MTNLKQRINIGEFRVGELGGWGPSFIVNLADVIEKIQPIIQATPDEVKHSIELSFNPLASRHSGFSEHYSGITEVNITREMTVEEYEKAGDAPSRASKITAIKKCFDSSAWTGRK